MSKPTDEKRKNEVEAAIRSLYDLFPIQNGYSCNRTKTKKTMEISRKIAARKAQLEKDAKLVSLERQLKEEQSRVVDYVKAKRKRVDSLLRTFRLRGESDALIRDVEKLAAEEPVVYYDADCE